MVFVHLDDVRLIDPLTCVVRGCGEALEHLEKLGAIFIND